MKTFARYGFAVMVALVLGLTAVAQDKKPIERKPADKEPANDQEFVVRALACDMAEVKMAELALKQAQSDDVKKFAARMKDDHTKNHQALMDRAKDMKVAVVEGLEKDTREKMDQLGKLTGSAFDREYMNAQVEGHEKALHMYESFSKQSKDEKLRDQIQKAIPTIKDHLEMARQIKAKLK